MKQAFIPLFCCCLFILTSFDTADPAHKLIGIWESAEKNLQIEMYEDNGRIAGRMIYFKCASDDIMMAAMDIENPDENLTQRKLLGLTLVTALQYTGDNVWENGKIYDPNSGHTFEARIQVTDQSAIVRGYWKYKWLGRSMDFKRIK